MDDSVEEKDVEVQYELHKAVFDNDLKKLNQMIKTNKDLIDRKVKILLSALDWPHLLNELVSRVIIRISTATQRSTSHRCSARKVRKLVSRWNEKIFHINQTELWPVSPRRVHLSASERACNSQREELLGLDTAGRGDIAR
jgi:hypothetical protein